jgi:hypothetical protein
MGKSIPESLLEELEGPSNSSYRALEILQRHILETGHRLILKDVGEDPYFLTHFFGCHECEVTYIVTHGFLKEEGLGVLSEASEEIVACINRGEDFRVKYFGVRSRFERIQGEC